MKFMTCGSCSALCQVNPTGICLGCQRGFVNVPQEDAWVNSEERKKLKLLERKEEIENALQKRSPEKISLCKKTRSGPNVRTPHSKRKKVTQEG